MCQSGSVKEPLNWIVCALLSAAGCTRITGQTAVYVVVDPEHADQFLALMASMSEENGLTAHTGEARYSSGKTLHVIEARGGGLTFWLQNMPLSGQEDVDLCGAYPGGYPDPAQYFFYVEPGFFRGDQESADAVVTRLAARLKSLGYEVRSKPAVCGRAALASRRAAQ